jgi:RNA 2',3'-cyclic 3'-phosphodiesterase
MSTLQVRSFVSIDLDDPQVLAQVNSVMSTLLGIGGDLKPVERENIHVTLKFLGNVDRAKLETVKHALGKVQFKPFSLEVKGSGAFPSLGRMNVIWVGLGEGWTNISPIFEQTEKLFSELGFQRESRAFSPHVTVARVKSPRKKDEIARFLRDLVDKSFGTFKVDRVRLKESVLFPAGPKYSTLYEAVAQNP